MAIYIKTIIEVRITMKNLKYIIKWMLGLLLALKYIHGKDIYYLVYGHIGEAVYSLSMLPEIKKYRKIDKIHLIITEPFDQIALLYHDQFTDMKLISIKLMYCLALYSKSHVKFHNNIIGGGWFWTDNKYQAEVPETYIAGYCYNVMDLKIPYGAKHANITTPVSMDDLAFQKFVKKNKIKKGKAVLLIPYARSAAEMETEWWEKIAEHIKGKGYQVFTNVKDNTESVIKGTIPIWIPLRYVPGVIDYMGSCISIRCGLSDLIAVGGCEMEVVYREKNKEDEGLTGLWTWKLGKDKSLYTNKNVIKNETDFNVFLLKLSYKYSQI